MHLSKDYLNFEEKNFLDIMDDERQQHFERKKKKYKSYKKGFDRSRFKKKKKE
jgi:hypothetical protein